MFEIEDIVDCFSINFKTHFLGLYENRIWNRKRSSEPKEANDLCPSEYSFLTMIETTRSKSLYLLKLSNTMFKVNIFFKLFYWRISVHVFKV